MKLILQRKYFKPEYIIGDLTDGTGIWICNTLEPNHAAIPFGNYKVFLTLSPKLDRVTPELDDVPQRSGIRIHAGNSVKDTQGCILVGLNDKAGWLSDSLAYERKIVELISDEKSNEISIVSEEPYPESKKLMDEVMEKVKEATDATEVS
jgi:hypothetical protein